MEKFSSAPKPKAKIATPEKATLQGESLLAIKLREAAEKKKGGFVAQSIETFDKENNTEIDDKKLLELVDVFFQGVETDQTSIDQIILYIKSNPNEKRYRAEIIENIYRQYLHDGATPDLEGVLLLMEIEKAGGASLFSPALTLELSQSFDTSRLEKYAYMAAQSKDLQTVVKLHKILDFFQIYNNSYHNVTPDLEEYSLLREYRDWVPQTMDTTMPLVVDEVGMLSDNYLLKKHTGDARASADLYGAKINGMPGSPGGMSDDTIFSHKVLRTSNELRRALHIWDGYPIANEVVPLAPGYVGYYTHGNLEKVYLYNPLESEDSLHAEDAEFIAKNNPELNWIYEDLNIRMPTHLHSSRGLGKLRSIWKLNDKLKEDDQFYFDISRIDMANLHPTVSSDLLRRNFEYLQRAHADSETTSHPLTAEQIQEKLFLGRKSTEQEYLYNYFSSFSMREKIEAEFTISISSLKFAEQFAFLEMLSGAETEDFLITKKLCSDFGVNFLRVFLVTREDPILQKNIIAFSQQISHETGEEVFGAYGKLIDSIDSVGEYLSEAFKVEEKGATGAVIERMFERARSLLRNVHAHNEDPQKLLELVQSVQADIHLFTDACRVLRARGELSLEKIKDASFEQVEAGEISPQDKEVMQKIWESHYGGKYESKNLEDALRKQFEESFEKPNTHFYLFKHKGEIVSYFSSGMVGMSEEEKPKKHLASFLTSQSYEGGNLGQAVMEKGLDEEQKGSILVGECDTNVVTTPIVEKYFEKYNFLGVRWYEEDGEPTLALERREGEPFKTKLLSKEEVRTKATDSVETETEKYRVTDQVPDFKSELEGGFVLTRYFVETDKETGQKKYYTAFELDSDAKPKIS